MSLQQDKFKAIADKIREKTGTTDKIVPNDFVNKIDGVYDKGVSDGKQSQYDEFWDRYQNNGNRRGYAYGFTGEGWTAETFKPKYDIICHSGDITYIFSRALGNVDLIQHLKDIGKKIDTSKVNSFSLAFGYFYGTSLPTIDTSSASNLSQMFRQANDLKTIEKIILGSYNHNFTDAFYACTALEDITFEGVISTNIAFAYTYSGENYGSPLTKASITSIVNALSSTTGATVTLLDDTVNKAFGIDVNDPSTYPEGSEYYKLRWSKPNWTFNYLKKE